MAVTLWKLLEGSLGAGSVSRRGVRGSCHSAEPASCSFGFSSEHLNYEENFFLFVLFLLPRWLIQAVDCTMVVLDARKVVRCHGGAPVACPRRLPVNVAARHWSE